MKSVLVLMAAREITQYIQWSKKGREFTDENIQRWASATILNVYDPHEIVSYPVSSSSVDMPTCCIACLDTYTRH